MSQDNVVSNGEEKRPSDRVASTIVVEFDGSRAEPVLIVGDICMSENIINIQEDNEWCWRQER